MDPATVVGIASTLKDYGPWALLAIAFGVIAKMYRDNQVCNSTTHTDRERLIVALEGQKYANEKVELTLQSLRALVETRQAGMGELSHQLNLLSQSTQHTLGNMASSVQAVARLIERDRGRS